MPLTTLPADFTILAIETSCDETAAAIVRGGREIIANVVASQIDEHRRYGGIVPEVASRQHILALPAVIEEALARLPSGWDGINAIAATYGPGLSGALLTGLNAAKAIAWTRGLPFVGVNHLEAHIYANWLISSPQSAVGSRQSAAPAEQATVSSQQSAVGSRQSAVSSQQPAATRYCQLPIANCDLPRRG